MNVVFSHRLLIDWVVGVWGCYMEALNWLIACSIQMHLFVHTWLFKNTTRSGYTKPTSSHTWGYVCMYVCMYVCSYVRTLKVVHCLSQSRRYTVG